MWLLQFNEYTVLLLVLAVGLTAIFLIRRFPGYKPTGQKKATRQKGDSGMHPILHRRQDHHRDDHDRHV